VLDVVLPLLDYAVLRLDQLEALEEALVLFLNEVEDGEGLEDVQGDVAHVRVETHQALQVRVPVKFYHFFFHIDLHLGSRLLRQHLLTVRQR
jgi:hypothetical protein